MSAVVPACFTALVMGLLDDPVRGRPYAGIERTGIPLLGHCNRCAGLLNGAEQAFAASRPG